MWEPKPGSYAARNAGIADSDGRYVFFTDSDCRPDRGWIEAGLAALATGPDNGRITGPVELFPAGTAWTDAEVYDRVFNLRQDRYVERGYGATANLAVPRRLIALVGDFDAALKSSGDKEWNRRAAQAGAPIALVSGMRVRHPARASFAELAKKRERTTWGRLALKKQTGPVAWMKALKFLVPAPATLGRILREPGLSLRLKIALAAVDYRLRLVEFATTVRHLQGR